MAMGFAFNNLLVWKLLLTIFTLHAFAERPAMAASNMTEADYALRNIQSVNPLSYEFSMTKDMSIEDAIALHYNVTIHGLSFLHDSQTSRANKVKLEAVAIVNSSVSKLVSTKVQSSVTESVGVNTHSSVTESVGANGRSSVAESVGANDHSGITEFVGANIYSSVTESAEIEDRSLFQGNNSTELVGQALNTTNDVVEETISTTTTATTPQQPLNVYWQQVLSEQLFAYVSPFLIVVGTVGNVMSLVALQNRLFRSSSTGFILSALSTLDIAVLNTGLMRQWILNGFGFDVRDLSRFGCKLHFLLTYYLHQLASSTLLLLTVERTISVWFALRCKQLCSRRRIVVSWLTIAGLLFAEHVFFFPAFDLYPTQFHVYANGTTSVEYEYVCTIREDWYNFWTIAWSYIDATVGDFFPFTVVLIGNILTIVRIVRSRWERERLQQVRSVASNSRSSGKVMASTTAMLIGCSVMFIVFSLPIDILFLYYAYRGSVLPPNEELAIYNLAYAVVTLFYYSNNALDFLVYLVSGRKFRQAFLETFLPCRKTAKPLSQQQSTIVQRNRNQESNNRSVVLQTEEEQTISVVTCSSGV